MEEIKNSGLEGEKQYGVWAVRSSMSICGAAQAWLKEDGKQLRFSTYAEAAAAAEHYHKNCYSPNVSYYPKEMELTSVMGMQLG